MAENSGIQWLTRDGINGATFNPWYSCSHAMYVGSDSREHVHPGCLNCYAEDLMDNRYGKCIWGSSGNRVVTSPGYWRKPDQWNRRATNRYRMSVFPSLCDPFEDWTGPMVNASGIRGFMSESRPLQPRWPTVGESLDGMRPLEMNDVRRKLFWEIDHTEWLDWLLFTKRPQNVLKMWPTIEQSGLAALQAAVEPLQVGHLRWPRQNVTLCYSASNQETLNYGVPLSLHCHGLCPTIGISLEPMLGVVDMRHVKLEVGTIDVLRGVYPGLPDGINPRIGWVIIGVESDGPRVGRLGDFASEADWWDAAAFVVQQCVDAGTPVFLKQGPRNGRIVDRLEDFPEPCRVRQFPVLAAV